jgi:hypothetical protein
MHVKHRELKFDDIPGPGQFNLRQTPGSDAPAYSFKGRIDSQKKRPDPPYQKIPDHFGVEGQKWSFGARPKTRDYVGAPGPNYLPPPFGTDGKKWTVQTSRDREVGHGKQTAGPGAGKYNVRPQTAGPRWSMKGRDFPPDFGKADGPGPGKYWPDYRRVLPGEGQGRLILERFKDKKVQETPGYHDVGTVDTGPKWTIPPREVLRIVPGCEV